MPEVDGRLVCCVCGADLGDADDPYRDPDCTACEKRVLLSCEEASGMWDRAGSVLLLWVVLVLLGLLLFG